jgi:nucleoside-diphosphate-sugar epimerase
VEYEADVTLIDSLIPEYGGNLFNIQGLEGKVKVNIADVRDRYSMNYLVRNQDLMFNLAGTLSHIDSMRDPFTDLEINCVSQLSILEACRQHNKDIKIVFAGTRGQYGRAHYLPVDEAHPMHPTDVNGINNIAGESYHLLYNYAHGIRATSLRLTNTYGPRHQMRHHRQGIINWFIRQAIDGQTIRLFGDGLQVRDSNYIDDVVDILLLAAANDASDGEVFNIGGEALSLASIVEKLSHAIECKYELVPFPPEASVVEVGNYVADWTKAANAFGWAPKVNFDEGLKRTIAYYTKYREKYW